MSRGIVRVNRSGLAPLLARQPLHKYVRDIIARWAFIETDAKGKAFRTTRDYAFWRLWILLVPIFNVAVYAFVFGIVLKVDRGIDNYLSFLVIGVIFFSFLQSFLTAGVGLVQVNKNLINSFNFPRATIVVSHALRYFLDNLVPALVAIILAVIFRDGLHISGSLFFVVPLYFLMHIFGLGLMLLIARASAFRPETKVAVNLLSQAWFFVSGVFYSVDRFDGHHLLQLAMSLNPAYVFLSAVRECVVYDDIPASHLWIQACAWSFGLLVVGLAYFWRAEERYANLT